MKISEKTQLNVINSRWGSRLTLNFNFLEKSVETGNLGIDASIKEKIKYSKQQLHQFKFFVKAGGSLEEGFYISKLSSYLASQELSIGLTQLTLKGRHSSELSVELIIRSPIASALSLEEIANIKVLHAPFFYIEIIIENLGKKLQPIETFLGFDLDEKEHQENKDIIYIDKGKNEIDKKEMDIALRNLSPEIAKYYKDSNDIFKGFIANKELKAGEKLKLEYIYAGFAEGAVFLNQLDDYKKYKLKFYYTQLFKSLSDVLNYAQEQRNSILKEAENFEKLLDNYNAPPEKKEIVALAFRTFLANSWLLISDSGVPEYYVWEGSFAMNSTVDVAMEVELLAKLNPWTLNLQLNEWKKYITTSKNSGFIYLKHDMGFDQTVGFSHYEKKGPRVAMPVEENANFAILLYWYYFLTKDEATLEQLYPTAFNLCVANKNRGYRNSGIAGVDIYTTYDESETLRSAPQNIYLGIKECVAYIMCRELGKVLKDFINIELLQKEAKKIFDTLSYFYEKYGYLPISLDNTCKGWNQKTIATLDPLFYVAMTDLKDPIMIGIINLVKKDFDAAYRKCERVYGVRLVENEEITWFSKIAIIDAVSNILYNIKVDSSKYAFELNKNNPKAFCDGAFSEKIEWSGHRYPRGVALMWEIIYNYLK